TRLDATSSAVKYPEEIFGLVDRIAETMVHKLTNNKIKVGMVKYSLLSNFLRSNAIIIERMMELTVIRIFALLSAISLNLWLLVEVIRNIVSIPLSGLFSFSAFFFTFS